MNRSGGTRWRRSGFGLSLAMIGACGLPGVGLGLGTAQAASETSPGFSDRAWPFAYQADVALGVGSTRYTAAISFHALYGFGESRWLRVGLGGRYSSAFGGDNVAFKSPDEASTLTVSSSQTQSLNAAFHLQVNPIDGLVLGFDIDFIGLGFGISKTGSYGSPNPSLNGDQSANPSSFNLLLGGSSDKGQLNSEFYVAYWFADRWAVRAGVSHFTSEYKTVRKLDFGNDRFRHSSTFPFAALSYRF